MVGPGLSAVRVTGLANSGPRSVQARLLANGLLRIGVLVKKKLVEKRSYR